jgi:acyl carrier protein
MVVLGIPIEWEEMLEVYTVKDVVDLIEKKVGR